MYRGGHYPVNYTRVVLHNGMGSCFVGGFKNRDTAVIGVLYPVFGFAYKLYYAFLIQTGKVSKVLSYYAVGIFGPVFGFSIVRG